MEEAGPMWTPEHINSALLDERAGKLENEEFKQVSGSSHPGSFLNVSCNTSYNIVLGSCPGS